MAATRFAGSTGLATCIWQPSLKARSRAFDPAYAVIAKAGRHIVGAARLMDKTLASTQDAATRTAVGEARTALAAVLTLNGVVDSGGSRAKGASMNGGAKPDAERVARYIADHPGNRAEDIATALGTDTALLRPALMKLKSLGAVEPNRKARATKYYATAG